ncbi:MAG: arylsulfatase [Kiritimatiellia bacterium]|jgi:arylsulfatase A-like enzyme|nr:arylsulfatase [Kiritimatiellia bacterium]
MTRRFYLFAAVFFAMITIMANISTAKPNIVFILADDLGYRELGCYGQEKIRTPNIDRLASQGMRFMRHYSGAPVCAPSRCVLMTGMHTGHATIRNNSEHKPEGQGPIRGEDVTIAELLKARGYRCGAFGKWGLGFPGSAGDPLKQGFDRFFGYNCQRHAHSYYPNYLWSDDERIPLNNKPPVPGHARLPKDADPKDPASYERYKGKDYASDRIAEQVLAFIRDSKDRPFFVYYPTIIPHLALHVPEDSLKEYTKLGWEDPPHSARYTPHFNPRACYAGMITRMDNYVGRVMDLLKELGLEENTIVVFTSDNGATYLGPMAEFFNSVGPLRGLKGQSYEGGLRVPAIVRYPGKTKAGSTSERISGFEDWMPTLLDMVGHSNDVPESTDGISLAKTLRGLPQDLRPFLYREFSGYSGHQAVWMGPWKGIRTGMQKGNKTIQLYNLEKDVSEDDDVAQKHPDIVARMTEIMSQQHTPSERFPLKAIDGK